jgi:hypothetical protein
LKFSVQSPANVLQLPPSGPASPLPLQAPPTQLWPVGHWLSQAPQFSGSLAKSTQPVPWLLSQQPGMAPGQTLPQPPQVLGSSGSRQLPLQHAASSSPAQTVSQAPQLLESLERSLHTRSPSSGQQAGVVPLQLAVQAPLSFFPSQPAGAMPMARRAATRNRATPLGCGRIVQY